jgi:glycosyltransferase involved in cell wall biosynthesis
LPRKFFLYVGRFAPEKNLRMLVQAFSVASHHAAVEGWGLVLVGGGPLEEVLRRDALPMGDRIRFVAFQQIDGLPAYYGLADALILPSLTEPWGLVVNEAMASGLPVVVSHQCGCVLDLVFPGVNGFVTDPHDPKSLAAALVAIAAEPERRQAYGRESARIIQNFSLETWARSLAACGLVLSGTSVSMSKAGEKSPHG